jgi:hypothetical protein
MNADIIDYSYIGDERLMLWTSRRERAQEYKQLFEADWSRYWHWYRNHVEPLSEVADWWRSNEAIPTCFKVIETLLPRYILGMFDAPDWFTVEARQRRNEGYEYMVESLLKATIEEMELFPKMYEALKYAMIMGHAWAKVVWKEEYVKRQVLVPTPVETADGGMAVGVEAQVVMEEAYNNVEFEWRPLDRIFPDPTGYNEWFIEEIDTTLEKLQDLQDKLGVYDSEAFNALFAAMPPGRQRQYDTLGDARTGTAAGVSVEYQREPDSTEGIPNHYVSPMRDGVGVKLWQCWGWVPKDQRGDDGAEWRLVVIAEGKYILRDEPSPTPDGKPPYFAIKSIPIPGRLYGESVLKYVGPLNDRQNRIANMRLDEVYLGIWQQYLYRANSVVSDSQLLMQPGGAIQVAVEQGQSIAETFMVLPRKPVMPDAYNEDQYRQMQSEHAAAASDIMQGVSASDRQTATEVERRLQQGNARHMLQVMWNDYTVKKELLTRVWRWLQMRLTAPKLIKTVGEEYAAVDLAQIQIPINIVVAGGMFALSKETRLQMDQELVQLASSPMFAMYMRPDAILKRLLQDRGWKNPEAFIKTQQELMLEQLAAQYGMGPMGGGMAGAPGQEAGGPGSATPAAAGPGVSDMRGPGAQASMAGGQAQGRGSSMSGPG